jgi:UDP-glucose 4-epimerase
MKTKILITGGAGYIGSHTTLSLLTAGYDLVVLDNLCNSSAVSLDRVKTITGGSLTFIQGDIQDASLLSSLFSEHKIDSVLHFAGLKAVGESVAHPLRYYENNVHGSQVLLHACVNAGVFNVVFSSSATVYGEPTQMPITELCPVGQPTNPYGRSKLMVEDILRDLAASDPRWRIAILRYFNPVGAHESGLIGESPNGIPQNLLPYVTQVAVGKLPELAVFGSDYPTIDGTGVRDYIHIMDLAQGHLKALEALRSRSGVNVWNLGTGKGYSVLDIVNTFEAISGQKVPYRLFPRRPGDIGICYANPTKAERELGWKARLNLEAMLRDAWRWQRLNPNGFEGK